MLKPMMKPGEVAMAPASFFSSVPQYSVHLEATPVDFKLKLFKMDL